QKGAAPSFRAVKRSATRQLPRLPNVGIYSSLSLRDVINFLIALRAYLERRSDWDQRPNFFDLGISYSDTSVGPVRLEVQTTEPPVSAAQAVDFDIASRSYS